MYRYLLRLIFSTMLLKIQHELHYILKVGNALFWSMIPSQANAVFNSVIYLARNNRMKRYFYKLLNCRNVEKHLRRRVSPLPDATVNIKNE